MEASTKRDAQSVTVSAVTVAGSVYIDDEEDGGVGEGRMMNQEDIKTIEKELKLLAKSIMKSSTERQKQANLERFVHATLSKKFE